MTTNFLQTYSLAIRPDTDPTGTDSFGLTANMTGVSLAEGDQQFFTRTFYLENVDYDSGGSAADDGFTYGDFPGLENKTSGGAAQLDWGGEEYNMAKLKAIVIEVKAKEAFNTAFATGTLTSTGVLPTDGDTVTIGVTVYQFKTTTAAAYDVTIGASAAVALANLKKAINASGTPGVEYHAGTDVHVSVRAGDITATTLVLTAARSGTAGNSIATTETAAELSFAEATLTGGGEVPTTAVPRGLEGTVQVILAASILPGTGTMDFTTSSPGLFTFSIPDGWTPGASGRLTLVFTSTEAAPLGSTDVNAAVTVTFVGSSS